MPLFRKCQEIKFGLKCRVLQFPLCPSHCCTNTDNNFVTLFRWRGVVNKGTGDKIGVLV